MFEFLVVIIACAFAGYTVGRTLTQESFAANWMNRIIASTAVQDKPGIYVYYDAGTDSYEVIQRIEPQDGKDAELVVLSTEPYRIPYNSSKTVQQIVRPFAIVWFKFGQLLECVYCLSAQTALQLAFWYLAPFGFIPFWVIVVLAVPAVTYIMNDYANSHLD